MKGVLAINRQVIDRFNLVFRAALINRFGEIPTADKLAIEFNFRIIKGNPISRESARKWINGKSMPKLPRLKLLISWLNLDPIFIFETNFVDIEATNLNIINSEDIRQLQSYHLRKSEKLGQAAINFVSPLTAILDKDGLIILVNDAWRAAAMLYPKLVNGKLGCEGVNYLQVCENSAGVGSEEANQVAKSIREVIRDNSRTFNIKYPCHSKDDRRWFEVKVSAFKQKSDICYIVTHMPITETIYNLK